MSYIHIEENKISRKLKDMVSQAKNDISMWSFKEQHLSEELEPLENYVCGVYDGYFYESYIYRFMKNYDCPDSLNQLFKYIREEILPIPNPTPEEDLIIDYIMNSIGMDEKSIEEFFNYYHRTGDEIEVVSDASVLGTFAMQVKNKSNETYHLLWTNGCSFSEAQFEEVQFESFPPKSY